MPVGIPLVIDPQAHQGRHWVGGPYRPTHPRTLQTPPQSLAKLSIGPLEIGPPARSYLG